jgi:ribose transport system substrate-binding protein
MSRGRLCTAIIGCVLVAVVVAACGGGGSSSSSGATEAGTTSSTEGSSGETTGSSGKPIKIDIGNGTLEYPAGTKPKIAMFTPTGVAYPEVALETAKKKAEEYGYEMTVFEEIYEADALHSQLQNALSGGEGEFNTWLVEPFAGEIVCSTIQEAGKKNIAVFQWDDFSCIGGTQAAGEESWAPGTVSSLSGSTTLTYYEAFGKKVAEELPAGAEVGVLTGLSNVPSTQALAKGLSSAGIKPVVEGNCSAYTTPEGLSLTQNMLQGKPNLKAVVSIYSALTVGAARAIEQAGKTDEVELYDLGGTKEDVELIEKEQLKLTLPYYPGTLGTETVEAVHKAFEGEPVERFYDAFPPGSGTAEEPLFVTKSNVSEFEPEY